MATAVQIAQSSALNPQTPATTAPVREHGCLFTHDLRRKQKRWQDGRLKHHTFNGKVMVYDDRGNFIGETHWQEDYPLDDGEELELERGGVIVQVAECLASRQQDLSELIDKRAQERAVRQAAAAAARRPLIAQASSFNPPTPQSLPQKHLHTVIGTPSGHHGRANIPTESPYEQRQRSEDTRPTKRLKRAVSPPSKHGYAQNLFGAALTLSGRPLSQTSVRYRPSQGPRLQEDGMPSKQSDQTEDSNTSVGAANKSNSGADVILSQHRAQSNNVHRDAVLQRPMEAVAEIRPVQPPPLPVPRTGATLPVKHTNPRDQHSTSTPRFDKQKEQANTSVLQTLPVNHSLRGPKRPDMSTDKGKQNPETEEPVSSTRNSKSISSSKKVDLSTGRARGVISQSSMNPKVLNSRKIVDLTEDLPNDLLEEPTIDEPRTKLRIKPRKKPGLVMVSEHIAPRNLSSSRSRKNKEHGRHSSLFPDDDISKISNGVNLQQRSSSDVELIRSSASSENFILDTLPRNTAGTKANGGHKEQSKVASHPGQVDVHADRECQKERSAALTKQSSESISVAQQPQSDATEPDTTERPTRQKRQKSSSEDDMQLSNDNRIRKRPATAPQEANEPAQDNPAPRLAKLSRKSIKSREVIGLAFDDEPDIPRSVERNVTGSSKQQQPEHGERPLIQSLPTAAAGKACHESAHQAEEEQCTSRSFAQHRVGASGLRRQESRSSHTSNASDTNASHSNKNQVTNAVTALEKPRTVLMNPATRGKKAARPSDMAGQVPVCPLPPELTGNMSLHSGSKTSDVTDIPNKRTVGSMPGFSRANGGPWSREAYDLFDFKRSP
ncbi:hypothetical protein GGR57DRAFT_498578 [Xylariaceae sp. FL1272]|nr:hypothetical protein GGR57DRAFT_498578 [Xylariaceae sp. FL1272]